MMLFWIPLLFIILWAFWRMARHGEVGMGAGCCGMTHNGHSAMQGTPPAGQADPVEMVRQRLARGEITPEEYDIIRRALG
jgi:uncharacterized membrane protein